MQLITYITPRRAMCIHASKLKSPAPQAALSRLRADKDREIERLEGVVREHDRKARVVAEFLERKEAMETELQVGGACV